MKVIKEGGHRLFEEDQETTRYVREMLDDIRKNGMDAVRKYSQKFDHWNPDNFELTQPQIDEAIGKCDQQLVRILSAECPRLCRSATGDHAAPGSGN